MKKILSIFMFLAIFSSFAQAEKVLRIGVEGAYPPFSQTNSDGSLSGFDIDIANALCSQMNVKCKLVKQDWDGIIPALLARKYDAIIASMTINEGVKRKLTSPINTTLHQHVLWCVKTLILILSTLA